MRIEDSFFPVIAAELGTSMDAAERYQQKLKDFLPTVKVFWICIFHKRNQY